jgi:hypothetical protein
VNENDQEEVKEALSDTTWNLEIIPPWQDVPS